MTLIGIDPGQSGAIAYYDATTRQAHYAPMPATPKIGVNLADLLRLLTLGPEVGSPEVLVVVERAQAMPKQGISSTFSYARDYGAILGILTALQLPYVTVPPATWHRELVGAHRGEARDQAKARAHRLVTERLPEVTLPKQKAIRLGVVDALCLCLWGAKELPASRRSA